MRLFSILCLSLIFFCSPLYAEEVSSSEQIIASQIKQLESQQKTPETIKKLEAYQTAQTQLEKTSNFNQSTRRYEKLMSTFPEQQAAIKQKIDNFSATEFPEFND